MLLQQATIFCIKVNNELNFFNIEKKQLIWKLKYNYSEGDCEESKEKYIRDYFYIESTNKADQDKLYVYVDGYEGKKYFYKINFNSSFSDIFKTENLIWTIENTLIGSSAYNMVVTKNMY